MTAGLSKERIRCRPIAASDLAAVAELLCNGFAGRSAASIRLGLERLSGRQPPAGAQRYGYCLDTGQRLVGAVLLIASERPIDGRPAVFCNVASWYVMPDYRAYAQLLISIALRNREFTYLNVSPAPRTWPIVENQGYSRYCRGLFFTLAALKRPRPDTSIEPFDSQRHAGIAQAEMLRWHQQWGCDVLVARRGESLSGFVFRRFRIRSGRLAMPAMFVIHAADRDELIAFAGNIGRHFLKSAAPILIMDADGPVPGLIGAFTDRRGRKYYKGPNRPKLCDLAATEFAIFGL